MSCVAIPKEFYTSVLISRFHDINVGVVRNTVPLRKVENKKQKIYVYSGCFRKRDKTVSCTNDAISHERQSSNRPLRYRDRSGSKIVLPRLGVVGRCRTSSGLNRPFISLCSALIIQLRPHPASLPSSAKLYRER